MHHDLHALDTSRTWVTRVNLIDKPRAKQAKKSQNSLKRGVGQPFIAKGHVTCARAVP